MYYVVYKTGWCIVQVLWMSFSKEDMRKLKKVLKDLKISMHIKGRNSYNVFEENALAKLSELDNQSTEIY